MSVITEEVRLKDGISGPAKAAGASVKTLEHEMTVLKSALKSTQDAMVKAQATGNTKQYAALMKSSEQYKASLGQLGQQMQATGGSSMDMQAELAEMTGGLSAVAEVAAGVVLAFGAVVVAGMSMAIEAAEAKQKMVSLFDALGEGLISGKETVAMLDQIGDSIGQTRAQLAPITQSFMTLGINSKEALEGLTKAAASAGAMAVGGAEKFAAFYGVVDAAAQTGSKLTIPFKKLEKQLQGVGLNIGDMAKQMGMSQEALTAGLKAGTIDAAKFGDALTDAASDKGAGALAQQGHSLTNIWAKFQENIMKMFENIDVGPFLDQVKSLFDIFGQGKPSGEALTAGIGGFFKNAFAQATKLVPLVKHFLLDVIIYGLKAYLAVKPIIKAIKDFIESARGAAIIKTVLSAIWEVLKVVGISIAVVVVAAVALWAAMVAVSVAVWAAIGAFVSLMSDGIDASINAWKELGGAISDFISGAIDTLTAWASGAAEMATNFVKGLVDGIKNGAAQVVGAVKGLADGAKNAFKGALGISSPSKVMMEMGGHAASGVSEGISAGVPDVHAASKDLAGAAAGGFAAGGDAPAPSPATGGSGSGVNVTVEAGAFVIQGGSSASLLDLTEQAVSLLFERVALAQGL